MKNAVAVLLKQTNKPVSQSESEEDYIEQDSSDEQESINEMEESVEENEEQQDDITSEQIRQMREVVKANAL